MNHTEATQYIKATLTAFGPDEAITMTQDTWAKLHEAMGEMLAEQPAQEPVAWIEHEWSGSGLKHLHFDRREPSVRDEVMNPVWTPLYTSPPAQHTWVGLTESEKSAALYDTDGMTLDYEDYAEAIEAKLKAKNFA